ncbi:MAG TPA: hypothetical protein PKM34_04945, partial [Bacteroidales bacterium]|nr:hypothetical protein [Bacteroidales bacterium]
VNRPEPTKSMKQTEEIIFNALRTYSNVHRGSGYNSMVTTENYEQAKLKVLGFMGLDKKSHKVVFCSPRQSQVITSGMKPGSYQVLSSIDTGLAIGLRAITANEKPFRWYLKLPAEALRA